MRGVIAAGLRGRGRAGAARPRPRPRRRRAPAADPEPARDAITQLPWAQQLLDLDRTWPHSTGAGVTVAVVDSGVDADHPQLQGKVLPGADFFLVGDLPGNFDCVSHGTAVASIIAASPVPGVGFRGVAPDARDPAGADHRPRAQRQRRPPPRSTRTSSPTASATPPTSGAKVINLSLSGYGDYPADPRRRRLRADQGRAAGRRRRQPGGPRSGAVLPRLLRRRARRRLHQHRGRPRAGLAGRPVRRPGGAGRGRGRRVQRGRPRVLGRAPASRRRSCPASRHSSASAHPKLTAPAGGRPHPRDRRPGPRRKSSLEYGAGIVDPYRAVTEDLTDREPLAAPAVSPKPPDPAATRERAWWADMSTGAKIGAGLVVLAIIVAAILAVALPRAHRRRWAATRRAAATEHPGRTRPRTRSSCSGHDAPIWPAGPFERPRSAPSGRAARRTAMAERARCTAPRSSCSACVDGRSSGSQEILVLLARRAEVGVADLVLLTGVVRPADGHRAGGEAHPVRTVLR